jgi:hypothetical protein
MVIQDLQDAIKALSFMGYAKHPRINMDEVQKSFHNYPDVFELSIRSESNLTIETALVRTDEFKENEIFKSLVEKITGNTYSNVELPAVISNYFDDLNADDEVKFREFKGSQVRYLESGSKHYQWKYLDEDFTVGIRFVKRLYISDIVNKNAEILNTHLISYLSQLEEYTNEVKRVSEKLNISDNNKKLKKGVAVKKAGRFAGSGKAQNIKLK